MRHGQTNGIPQGSTLMDFVAEVVLGNMDVELTRRLEDAGLVRSEYRIIRYRDDYKIFINNPESGRLIIKELSSALSGFGMKLNTSKTKMNSDPVLASIKEDKLHELMIPNNRMSMSKRLLQIYAGSEKYPNSGLVTRKLNDFYKQLQKMHKLNIYDDPHVMIGIITNLAVKNPKSYQWCMAILSLLLDFCLPEDRLKVIDEIREKFESIPNTGLLDIWLQRISYNIDPRILYNENLAKIASQDYATNVIWKSSWLEDGLINIVANTPIVKSNVITTMSNVIEPQEVALFNYPRLS